MMRVICKEHIEKSSVSNILVRATNWVGDMVISLPALEAIRDNFPESKIAVIARPWVIPLLERHHVADKIIPLRKGRGYFTDLLEVIRVAGMLRRMRFDMAILFQNAFEAAFLAYLGRVRFRVGYNTDGRGFLLTHKIIRDDSILRLHQAEYYLSILRAMEWEAENRNPSLTVGEEDMESIHSLLISGGIGRDDILVGLSPGAIYGPAKRWPPERFAVIGDWAEEKWGAKVVIMGSGGEQEICELLAEAMKYTPLNLCGETSLGQAAALIKRCQFFVTNDSGLMHVAAALSVPMVAIFGSTDHVATGPLSSTAKIVRNNVDCAPCLKPECNRDFGCMLGIRPEDVWNELEMLKATYK
ncbi:lipopolysaccharide heptosyltransferase II [Thermodesulfobacteriota bacterium]